MQREPPVASAAGSEALNPSQDSTAAPANDTGTVVARLGRSIPSLSALLLMLILVTIPPPPMRLDIDVDSSLSGVLNYAHEHGLQHGRDVVFTYGPLGFLTFFYFSPHVPGLRMAFDVALGFTVASGLCWLAWRMRVVWRSLLLVVAAWIGANVWPRTDWVINCGMLSWGLLCFLESGRRLTFAASVFVTFAAVVALSKGSFLVFSSMSIGLLAVDLWVRQRRRLASGVGAGFGLGYLLGWWMAGQHLANLPDYFAKTLDLIRGYNAALGWEGAEMVRKSGWQLAWLLPVVVLVRTLWALPSTGKIGWWRRVILSIWVGAFTFTIWKHGWVRVDPFHVKMFLGSVTVLALALEALPSDSSRACLVARAFAVVACLSALGSWQSLYVPGLWQSLIAPGQTLVDHAKSLLHPAGYFKRMRQTLETNRREAQLPQLREMVGKATVDVFGQHPGYALFNDMNYHPRPVFQSYAACNASLMRLNEAFYRSPRAPQFVLFQLVGMDGRLPVLEDAWLLRYLLTNYEPVAMEKQFLLLKASTTDAPRLSLLRAGEIAPGELIDVSQFAGQDLWLEADVQPTLLGRLRQFFSRPAIVKLATWRDSTNQWTFRHRAPPSTLAAGFLASPLLLRNEDVQNVYAGEGLVRPRGYSLEIAPEDARYWSPIISYRLYHIENALGRRLNVEAVRELFLQSSNAPLDGAGRR